MCSLLGAYHTSVNLTLFFLVSQPAAIEFLSSYFVTVKFVLFCSEEECAKAFALFNARWYASKQLSCEFSPVTKWKSAICGMFSKCLFMS